MHVYPVALRLGHTDAAGVVFQAEFFRLLHEAYEDLLEQAGFPLARVIRAGRIGLPLVRVEGDFKMPLRLGDRLAIAVAAEEVGAHHFVLCYRVRKGRQLAASGRSVHVAVSRATGRPCPLPAALRRLLRPHQTGCG